MKTEVIEKNYALYNGDCVSVMEKLPELSIDLSIYSPPFCGLYVYSSSERDLSNCRTYKEFFEHYAYVVEHIARLTKPGRISAVHCADIPKKGANIGGYRDFPGDTIKLHKKLGFEYLPRICIWKEPLGVRNRTMAKSLAHRQIVEDSTQTNVAAADYLIPFRKKGSNKVPVTHPSGLTEYWGERKMPEELKVFRNFEGKQTQNRFSHWIWRQYASCFWNDIRINNVLPFINSRDEKDERHVHPLQLDVIARAITLWSNPGEVILTPFMGVSSEVFGAVALNRKAIGIEIKKTYFRQAIKNMKTAHEKRPVYQEGTLNLIQP